MEIETIMKSLDAQIEQLGNSSPKKLEELRERRCALAYEMEVFAVSVEADSQTVEDDAVKIMPLDTVAVCEEHDLHWVEVMDWSDGITFRRDFADGKDALIFALEIAVKERLDECAIGESFPWVRAWSKSINAG